MAQQAFTLSHYYVFLLEQTSIWMVFLNFPLCRCVLQSSGPVFMPQVQDLLLWRPCSTKRCKVC